MQFRPYQQNIIQEGTKRLSRLRIILLAMEVRTGKTLTSLGIANRMDISSVLFITKKKAISSIKHDYKLLNPSYSINITNYEAVHKVTANDYDLIIVDESHSLGAFPKASVRTKRIKEIIGSKYCILLSGTPTPESWSQIFHQFWISEYSPFAHNSFYAWAKSYVNVTQKFVAHGNKANDYSGANENLIRQKLSKHILSFSQKQAGFTSKVNEHILEVEMKPTTYKLVKTIEKDLVYEGKKGGVILADTPVKLMQKVHQLYSGTIKLEDGSATIIDNSKGVFIKKKFQEKKIGIFYKFKEELKLLQSVFGDELTTELDEFNTTNKNIALQIVSGREGISLSKADYLVYFNIDFSATSYWQSRDRLTTKDRMQNDVYWIFSKGGLEQKIYQKVLEKKSFTTKHYERVSKNN
tara:strand:+ start:16 stop:1245 length:1230 start_codon:yes stop_codon:yes gene_type:complete